jgi:hypothetical protein
MSSTNPGPAQTTTNNTSIGLGNTTLDLLMQAALTPSAVSANTTAEQTFTVTGLQVGDMVAGINKPTAQAGLGIVGMRVSAANTLAITFSNNTAGSITPTAGETYVFQIVRPMPQYVGSLPTSLPL